MRRIGEVGLGHSIFTWNLCLDLLRRVGICIRNCTEYRVLGRYSDVQNHPRDIAKAIIKHASMGIQYVASTRYWPNPDFDLLIARVGRPES